MTSASFNRSVNYKPNGPKRMTCLLCGDTISTNALARAGHERGKKHQDARDQKSIVNWRDVERYAAEHNYKVVKNAPNDVEVFAPVGFSFEPGLHSIVVHYVQPQRVPPSAVLTAMKTECSKELLKCPADCICEEGKGEAR